MKDTTFLETQIGKHHSKIIFIYKNHFKFNNFRIIGLNTKKQQLCTCLTRRAIQQFQKTKQKNNLKRLQHGHNQTNKPRTHKSSFAKCKINLKEKFECFCIEPHLISCYFHELFDIHHVHICSCLSFDVKNIFTILISHVIDKKHY